MSRLAASLGPLPTASTTVFRASSLQREYRRVLDAAHEAPVPVLDKDNEMLVVERWSELAFSKGVVAALEDIHQFHAAYARHRTEAPRDWAAMTPYPWLAALAPDEVDEFASELMPYLFEAVRRRSLDVILGHLRAWESSAETFDDAELLAAADVTIVGAELVEIHPPSADRVAAVERHDSADAE